MSKHAIRISKIAFTLFDDFRVIHGGQFDDVILVVGNHRILFGWRSAIAEEAKSIYRSLYSYKRLFKRGCK